MAINLNILANGGLEITVNDREEFESILHREYQDERAYLSDLMDSARYTGNDWHCPFCIGLTEAPTIGQGAIYPEDDYYDELPTDYENLWYFPDYMILSCLEILETKGKVIFTGHPDNQCKKRKAA